MTLKKLLALALSATMLVASFTACSSTKPSDDTADKDDSSSSTDDKDVEEEKDTSFDTEDDDKTVEEAGLYPGTATPNSITANLGSEPTSLNSMLATYSHDFVCLNHMYTNLLELDENDNVVPGVADMPTVSDDGLTYTFKLREDCKWSNGTPVTANDFYFGWTTLLDPALASDYAYFAYIIKNAEAYYNGECGIEDVGIEVVNDYELVVTLERPTSYADFTFTFGSFIPVNEEFYNSVGADNYAMEPEYMISNGAFIMDSWTHDSKIVLKKNPDFIDADKVTLDEINFVMITDVNTALNALTAGELDIMGLTGEQTALLEDQGQKTFTYSSGSCFYLLFNHENEIMSNKNLRLALSNAFDRDAFIATVLGSSSLAAKSFTNPGVTGADGTSFAGAVEAKYGVLCPPNGDIEKAKEYLAKACEELDMTVEELSAVIELNGGDATTAVNTSAFFQEQWRVNLGLEITCNNMQTKAQSELRTAGNYMIDFTGWGPDYNDPNTFLDMWVSGNGSNTANYNNPEYDELVATAAASTDKQERQDAFLRLEEIIAEDAVLSPVYWRVDSYTVSDKITGGFSRSTFQDMRYMYTTTK